MNAFPNLLNQHRIINGHRIAAGVHGAGNRWC